MNLYKIPNFCYNPPKTIKIFFRIIVRVFLKQLKMKMLPKIILLIFSLTFGLTALKAEDFILPENPFTRLVRSEDGALRSFDTSLVTFVSQDGSQRVTLVGAIHIGEAVYYQTLNEKFTHFDAVLFEMVGNGDPRPVSAKESGGLVGSTQRLSAVMMGLKFQIGSIDYHAKNFVHADMTETEFKEAMKKRGDGLIVWFVRSLGYGTGAREKNVPDDWRSILELLVSQNRARALRRISAEGMAEIRSTTIPVEGKNGSTLIQDRNAKALQVLREQFNEGKKNVAIFYGAAHLPDFAERLQKDFGLKPEKMEWLQCWKLD